MPRILLCLAHMSGNEQKYINEAFADNWVVPLGPNVNGFEADLKKFIEDSRVTSDESRERGSLDSQQTLSRHSSLDSRPEIETLDSQQTLSRHSSLDSRPEIETLDSQQTLSRHSSLDSRQKEVVALSSGTAAVHLALIGCGVGPGDEVMVQSFTFCASANPVTYLGAKPVFVDSEPASWNMDPALLDRAIADRIAVTGRKPKAILPVYLYGMPADIDGIMAVARKYDIPVIEDAAEGMGSRYRGRVCGTFGRYGVLSFNGNKMITTSGGGALICESPEDKANIMFYATQARESYPYYQHEHIGYNYRLSNICAGIGRGQMTILDEHIAHHKHVAALYEQLFADIPGITFHKAPGEEYDANYWLSTITLDPDLKVKGQENVYSEVVSGAVGGAAGVTHRASSAHTACEPNPNVEAMRLCLDAAGIESRPLWKPMHLQPVFADAPAYVNGVSESLFRVGMCLPSGPYVTDDDVRYIVQTIKASLL